MTMTIYNLAQQKTVSSTGKFPIFERLKVKIRKFSTLSSREENENNWD
jgi:hypothetical protein